MEKNEFTAETFKAAFPEIHEEIRRAGFDAGVAEGLKTGREEGREAGAEAERGRIQSVLGKGIPGHEALVNELAFDGRTTGPEAAEKILEAEAALRKTKQASFVSDTPAPVKPAEPPVKEDPEAELANLPLEEQAKIRWDRSPELREQYKMGGFKAYLSYERNKEKVRSWKQQPG